MNFSKKFTRDQTSKEIFLSPKKTPLAIRKEIGLSQSRTGFVVAKNCKFPVTSQRKIYVFARNRFQNVQHLEDLRGELRDLIRRFISATGVDINEF
ncbi:MAG: hypothetical protein MHMPM18_004983 [Marteilia pararefringens]